MKQYLVLAMALSVIILLNIWQTNFLNKTSKYILADINDIENSVKRKDYETVLKGIRELENTWNIVESGWDIFGEHNDIEEINERIESMKVYAAYQDIEELANECKLLENIIKHVIESEKLNIGNVL